MGLSTLVAWGKNEGGKLGVVEDGLGGDAVVALRAPVIARPVPVETMDGVGDIRGLALSADHSVALVADADARGGDTTSLYSWGTPAMEGGGDAAAKLGRGHLPLNDVEFPDKVMGLDGVKIVDVVCGASFSAALCSEGGVWTWGSGGIKGGFLGFGGRKSCLGYDGPEMEPVPRRISTLWDDGVVVASIAAGNSHSMAVSDEGEVFSWGLGEFGRLGQGAAEDLLEPTHVEALSNIRVKKVACGEDFTLALTHDGEIYAWGKNDKSQLGIGGSVTMDTYASEPYPCLIESLADVEIVDVACGTSHALARDAEGKVYAWGLGVAGAFMAPTPLDNLNALELDIVQLAAGNKISAVLTARGEVYRWGRKVVSGDGSKKNVGSSTTPALVEDLRGVSYIACASKHMMAAVV